MTTFMTLEEVADYLRVAKKTVYRLLENRDIPARKIGHQWRFDKTSLDNWLNHKSPEKIASILVIDDDETVCSLFSDTLEGSGHQVTAVNDSFQALEMLKENEYDLVFLDLKMPRMNGAELFREIKSIKPDLPVTIITGYPESDLMMSALAHGPLGVMSKPFRGSDIIAAVDNYLRFGITNK